MLKVIDTSSFKELEYPKELFGAWVYYVFFKNHKSLGGIVCAYFNDKHPSGSVYVGEYILNDYPDVYGTWKKDNEFGKIVMDRVAVSPILRGKGVGKSAVYYGAKILEHFFNKTVSHEYGSQIGNKLYTSAFNTNLVKDTPIEGSIDLREEFFDQPAHPYIFFGKRAVR
jgi:GNAT superfamily N-acetyltransferase